MYDAKSVSPMEDYRRRNEKAAKLEDKREQLKVKRDATREVYRAEKDAERRAELFREMVGYSHDMTILFEEILEVWRARY